MKNLILVSLLAFYSQSILASTTAYLKATQYKTLPLPTTQLVPMGMTNIDELKGQTGFSFTIQNPNSQTVQIPAGTIGFMPPQVFNTFPLQGGGTSQVLQITPFHLWEANFPGMKVKLDKKIEKGCRNYKGTLSQSNPVYDLEVNVPQGVQFVSINTPIGGPQSPQLNILQNQNLTLTTYPATEVRLNICHYPEVDQNDDQPAQPSCEPMAKDRVKELAKKTIVGPLLTSVAFGGAGAAAAVGMLRSMGSELPQILINWLGREIIKQPSLAFAPVAGAIGIAVSAITFITYEAIVITKLVQAAKVHKAIKLAKEGKAHKSWAKALDRKIQKKKVEVRGWDPAKKEEIIGKAIKQMDLEGSICNGSLMSKRVQKKKKKKLRHLVARRKNKFLDHLMGRFASLTQYGKKGCKWAGSFYQVGDTITVNGKKLQCTNNGQWAMTH